MNKRVVITGIGIISSMGIGKENYWESLKTGKSGISKIKSFSTETFSCSSAGEVKDFVAEEFIKEKGVRYLSRIMKMGISASRMALFDSNYEIRQENEDDIGIIMGTTYSNLKSAGDFYREALKEGPKYVNPMFFPNTMHTASTSQISIYIKAKSINRTITNGETSSIEAIDYGSQIIKSGEAKAMIVGGMEELSYDLYQGLYSSGLLSGSKDNDVEFAAPFCKNRNGFIVGEGCAALVLEDMDEARNRGARIYGEILASSITMDPIVAKNGINKNADGIKRAINNSIKEANIKPEDVNYICASANSDINCDEMEMTAINQIFSDCNNTYTSSIKGAVGECIGATGAMQVSATLMGLHENVLPSNTNYNYSNDKYSIKNVLTEPLDKLCNIAIISSVGRCGSSGTLVLKKV